MPNIMDINHYTKNHEQHIIFVIDASQEMYGPKMAGVNQVMQSLRLKYLEKAENCVLNNLKISAGVYNYDCRWISPMPIDAEDYFWFDIFAEGYSHLEYALEQLNKEMLTQAQAGCYSSNLPPIIIFIAHAKPKNNEWRNALEKLRCNTWFERAMKFAIMYESSVEANEVFREIIGTPEALFVASNLHELKQMVHLSALTAIDQKKLDESWMYDSLETSNCITRKVREQLLRDLQEAPLLGVMPPEETEFVVPSLVDNEYGRAKCKLLKTIRKVVADANDIPYEITECNSTGHCNGACPACDQEAAELSEVLSRRARAGKQIQMPGMGTSMLDDFLPITSDMFGISEYDDEACGWFDTGW